MNKLVKRILTLCFAAMMLVSAVACQQQPVATEEPATDVSQPTESTEAVAEARDELVVALSYDADALDPLFVAQGQTGIFVNNHVFNPLVWRDDEMNLVPCLATEWETLDDLTWKFTLRDDVYFHSGNKMTSKDVKMSFERMYDERVVTSARWPSDVPFDYCEAPDDTTFILHLTKPCPGLLYYLMPGFYVLDSEVFEGTYEPVTENVSGTGPYKIVEWVRDDHITLERNDNYWGEKPAIRKLTFRVIPDASTRASELLAGNVDVIQSPPVEMLDQFETDTTTVVAADPGRLNMMIIDHTKYPFNDLRVRQALQYAIDKDAINQALMGGLGVVNSGICMPPNENTTDIQPYPYDPEKAKALLEEAGVPEGTELLVLTTTDRYVREKEATTAICNYLEAIGFKCTIEVYDQSVLVEKWDNHDFGNLCFRGLGGYFNGQGELAWVNISGTGWENLPAYQELYDQICSEMDLELRDELIQQAQVMVHDECVWGFLWRQPSFYACKRDVQWTPRPDEYMHFMGASIVE